MSSFKEFVEEFSKDSGLEIELSADNSFSLESDGIFITVQYTSENNTLTIYAPVVDPEKIPELTMPVLKSALKLAFNGVGTGGNYLGLLENTLILSKNLLLNALDTETFAENLLNFAEDASKVRDRLINYHQDENSVAPKTAVNVQSLIQGMPV